MLHKAQRTRYQVDQVWLERATYDDSVAELRRLVECGRLEAAHLLAGQLCERWPEDPAVLHWNRVLRPGTARVVRRTAESDGLREREWLLARRHEYPGCWIAVFGDEFIAADPDRRRVEEAVRARRGDGGATFYFQQEPTE